MTTFAAELWREIAANIDNAHKDNYDVHRYGPQNSGIAAKVSVKGWLRRLADSSLGPTIDAAKMAALSAAEPLYHYLEDPESKRLLVTLLTYRLLGHTKVKLPLSTSGSYWNDIQAATDLVEEASECIQLDFRGWRLFRMDLARIGYPIKLYYTPLGVYVDFIAKQYEYTNQTGMIIKATPGDVVIDAGGCYGDTALYFAHEVGRDGAVFSFEFLPSNLAIMRRNLSLNPELARTITIIERPLWDISEEHLEFLDNGPGTCVRGTRWKRGAKTVHAAAITIDDLVRERGIGKVDFIKMDIEGAECRALRGAAETIKRFRPKLAVAVYHSIGDFARVPEIIRSLEAGYKFYLKHATINADETILFCSYDDA